MRVHKREPVLSDTTDGKRERDARLAIVTKVDKGESLGVGRNLD